MNGQTNPVTTGAHHVGLTVPDLEKTKRFFVETLGYDQLGEVPDYPAVFLSDGSIMITLWQASDPAKALPFDRKNVIGLHHLALNVQDDAALDRTYELLQRDLHRRVDKIAWERLPMSRRKRLFRQAVG